MIHGRDLAREEIQRIWTIDRSEVIEAVYALEDSVSAGVLYSHRSEQLNYDP